MSWWEKGLRSVKDSAEKVSFEADKLVRVRREEGTLGELQNKVKGKMADLGQSALSLYRSGAFSDPTFGAAEREIAALETQIQQQLEKIEVIKSEQFQPEPGAPPEASAPAAPPSVPPAAAASPVPVQAESVPPQPGAMPVAAADTVECPSCHTQVRTSAAFCPECGTKMR